VVYSVLLLRPATPKFRRTVTKSVRTFHLFAVPLRAPFANSVEIVVQIDAVGSKIDAKVAADIKITLQVIIDLILKLCADLKVIILAGGLTVPDVKACVNICIAIVNLCISVLVKIRACVFVGINIKVFLSVFAALTACIKLLINLCLSVCLGTIGGLSVLQLTLVAYLVVLLNACLAAFVAVAVL
jgi:hypothetical protein